MNITTLSPLRKTALSILAKLWVSEFEQRKKELGIFSEEEQLQTLVWKVSNKIFNIYELDVMWVLDEHRPNYERFSKPNLTTSSFMFSLLPNEDTVLMVYDLLDNIFLCEIESLQKELADKISKGWFYQSVIDFMYDIT